MSAIEFSQYAIVTLIIALLVVPIRYAYFILLILPLFDASGPGFASASQVGVLNALKVLIAPAIIISRLKGLPFKALFRKGNGAFYAFIALIIYASIAIIWSPWKLSAFKMMGYLVGHIFWFAVIVHGWLSECINSRLLMGVFLTAIAAGIVQSYILEPSFGVYRFTPQRFTAFLSPQYYAAFLVFLTAILGLNFHKNRFFRNFVVLCMALIVIVRTGSRYSFIAMIFVVLLFLLSRIEYSRTTFVAIASVYALTLLAFTVLLAYSFGYAVSIPWIQETRIAELKYLLNDPEKIGTLAWRIGMYREAWSKIAKGDLRELLFGYGTSSAADVALGIDPRYTRVAIDANRVMHNEFLRGLYEWGIVGLALLAYIVLYLLIVAIRLSFKGSYSLLSVFPLLMIGLTIENVLASAGTGWGAGVALILGMVYAKWLKCCYAEGELTLCI